MANYDFTFQRCTFDHLPDLLAAQEEVFAQLTEPDILRRNSAETLRACLNPPHVTLGAFCGTLLAGFAILYFGGTGPENLGLDLGLTGTQLEQTANVKLVIVRPEYRGNSLQKRLCRRLEYYAHQQGVRTLCSTVAPSNLHSAKNLIALGYHRSHLLEKYNGLPRELYCKHLSPGETAYDRLYFAIQELLEEKEPSFDSDWGFLQAVADRSGMELQCSRENLDASAHPCSFEQLQSGDIALFRRDKSLRCGIVLGKLTRQFFFYRGEDHSVHLVSLARQTNGWGFDTGYATHRFLDEEIVFDDI